jgi:hypothetical protein
MAGRSGRKEKGRCRAYLAIGFAGLRKLGEVGSFVAVFIIINIDVAVFADGKLGICPTLGAAVDIGSDCSESISMLVKERCRHPVR